MCGRFALTSSPAELARQFDCLADLEVTPQYNISPTEQIAIVFNTQEEQSRIVDSAQWWLTPSFSKKGLDFSHPLFNARAETLSQKPSFKGLYNTRRCIIPVNAFYEWNEGQPYAFTVQGGELFGMAGLWDEWSDPDGLTVRSCTIITTEANSVVQPIHKKNRMPVILDPREYDLWLNPVDDITQLNVLLNPFESAAMEAYPVTKNLKQNNAHCLERISIEEAGGSQQDLFL